MPQQSHMLARIRTRGGERGLDGLIELGGGDPNSHQIQSDPNNYFTDLTPYS